MLQRMRMMPSPLQSICRKAMAMATGNNNRCFSFGSVQAAATPPHASHNRAIPVSVAPAVEDFVHGCYEAQTPLVIQGAMDTWASRKWTPEFLRDTFGHLNVPVELSFWNEEEGRWGDYRDLYKEHVTHASSKEYFMPHQPMSLSDFIEIFMCKRGNPSSSSPLIGYVAQHQLLTEVPEMANGIP